MPKFTFQLKRARNNVDNAWWVTLQMQLTSGPLSPAYLFVKNAPPQSLSSLLQKLFSGRGHA